MVAGTVAAIGPATAQPNAARAAADQRYQISQMERVFKGAVEHAATNVRDRLQAATQLPPDLLINDSANVRGFPLEGYGVVFDVVVPSFVSTQSWWSPRTLDKNAVGLDSALRTLQAHVKDARDPNLDQALKRVELELNPAGLGGTSTSGDPGARNATGSPSAVADQGHKDPILSDPSEAYRTEVLDVLKDALLAYSSSLRIQLNEWLTIVAKGNDDRSEVSPVDTRSGMRIIRMRGADLGEFHAGRMTRDEALERIETIVF